MFFVSLLVSSAVAGTYQPNWTLFALNPSSTSLGFRAHIEAYDNLTSPADIDYRLLVGGLAHGGKIAASEHAALKTAAGTAGSCDSFDTLMASTIGIVWWNALSGPEQDDACAIYQHLAGGADPGLVWWAEVHQQLDGNNTDRQYGQTDQWNASKLGDMLDDITVNSTTGAVTACGTPDLAPLSYTSRKSEEQVAICDLLASLK